MTTELETVVRTMLDTFDKKDFETALANTTSDAQGIDEISRRWLRDSDAIAGYFEELGPAISDVHSTLHDVQEREWGETALVTGWLEQDYVLGGDPVHISSPLTVVLRRVEGAWKIALIHAVPMPEES